MREATLVECAAPRIEVLDCCMKNVTGPIAAAQVQSLLDSPSVNVFSLDKDFRYVCFNRSHAEVTKSLWDVDLVEGMHWLDEVIRNEHDRQKAQSNLESALAGEELVVVEAYGQLPVRRLFENHYGPTRLQNGEIVGVTVFAFDVTERVKLAEERAALDRMLLETSQLESLGLMVGCVAHDFNNLLVPILLSAEMALKANEGREPIQDYLGTVIESTKSAADLTKQLLNFSDNSSTQQQLTDINDLIRGAAELARVSIRRRAELIISLAEHPILSWVNPTQLRQVILNLLINASEATQGPHPRVTIETSTLRVTGSVDSQVIFPERVAIGDYAILSVTDNGCGMSNEQLSQIFEPFYSTKGTGRGLGLTAVQGIVRAHKGFLAIVSLLGRGSTFRIGLPLASDCVSDASEPSDDYPVVAESSAGAMKILIADDSERVLNCLRRVCERLGHEVVTASSALKTVVAATSQKFDLILLDANMAGVSCNELLQSIPEDNLTPVALMSGEVHDAALIANPRVHSVLAKPFSVESLQALLSRFRSRNGDYKVPRSVSSTSRC